VSPQAILVFERTYRAPIEDLWALWTTKAGFESWWAPEGCRVKVRGLEARPGGMLEYDMIAEAPEAITAANTLGLPPSQPVRARFGEFRPHQRLTLVHMMDFMRDAGPREHMIEVDFSSAGGLASMVVAVHPHLDPVWTKTAIDGFNSQLARLDRRFGWPEPGRASVNFT
jgi:uncharacterized protein YndB with AHSA1/START domain